jgi:hypothetical protein
MFTRLISTYYSGHRLGCAGALNYLLFTILMIRGNNVGISIRIVVGHRWLVALETARGRSKCGDCLTAVVDAILLGPKERE